MTVAMSADAVFQPEGERFLPTALAVGPWGPDRLHGGPVLGLLVRAIERIVDDPQLVLARLTVDLFRAVPLTALSVRAEVVQRSRRLSIVQAAVFVEQTEYARASAVLLAPSEVEDAPPVWPAPDGPEGLSDESLMRGMKIGQVRPGFHTMIVTRWPPPAPDRALAVWFRLPVPLVAGETPSALQRMVAVSDFANAIASIASSQRDANALPYINTDSTLYLWRKPEGEWFALQEQLTQTAQGVSLAESTLYDTRGPLGRALQARLAYRRG
jgi:Thioesterase-like superfamily